MAKGAGKGKATPPILECCAVCGTAAVICMIVLIVLTLFAIGVAKIVIGAIYIHQCSLQRLVPIYLIVSGVTPILLGGFGRQSEGDSNAITAADVCAMIGFLFNVAWLICGTFWVYPTFSKAHANPTAGYCNAVLIDFAFGMVTLDWIFAGLWVILIIYMLYRTYCLPMTVQPSAA